jgi:hypothetical protein
MDLAMTVAALAFRMTHHARTSQTSNPNRETENIRTHLNPSGISNFHFSNRKLSTAGAGIRARLVGRSTRRSIKAIRKAER